MTKSKKQSGPVLEKSEKTKEEGFAQNLEKTVK